MDRSLSGGNAAPDPYSGWDTQAHPNAPAGGGGPGRFKMPGSLGTGNSLGSWHGLPHPLAPAARYLAVSDAYCDRGQHPPGRLVEEDGVYYVSLPGRAEMRPFLRTQNERFETTVKKVAARSQLAVVINGNMYKDNAFMAIPRHVLGNMGANISTQSASLTTPIGSVRGRGQALGGNPSQEMFFISWSEGGNGGYAFGKGEPPNDTTSAVGGLGPLIIAGQKYGPKNMYRRGVPEGAPDEGEPLPKFKAYLEIRSNRTYASIAGLPAGTGKVVIGVGPGELPVRIVVQPHGKHGVSMDHIRDKLAGQGVHDAVFLDGSDSALLFANGRFYAQPGTYKDRTNTVGIGFRLPFCSIGPGGRSLGHA